MVCGSFPDCRFLHYNNGSRSKKLVTIDLYVKLADIVPNLVAAKYLTQNLSEIYGIVTANFLLLFIWWIQGIRMGLWLENADF